MNSLLSVSASGLGAQSALLNAIATNVANADTPGFGARQAETATTPDQIQRPPNSVFSGQVVTPGWSDASGAEVLQDIPVFTDGVVPSAIPTNLAINGPGFFIVQQGNGTLAYTRAGQFQPDANGQLVLPDGSRLYPPVTVPSGGTYQVTADGRVVSDSGGTGQVIGQIQVARVPNPAGMTAIGNNLYLPSANSGTPVAQVPGSSGTGTLVAGALNASSVNLAESLTELVQAQSVYQLNSKAITVAQSLMNGLDNVKV